jgi:hypothetical protein
VIVGIGRNSRAQGGKFSILVFGTVGKVLKRHPVIALGVFCEQVF